MKKKKSNVFLNPYKHFYKTIELTRLKEESEVDIEIYEDSPYDKDVHQAYLDSLFEEAEKRKGHYLVESMKHDPGFMIDPVNEYYIPLIKKNLSSSQFEVLSEDQIMELVAILDPVTWGERNLLQKNGKNKKWTPRASRQGIPYQSMLIRSKGKNIAVRAGRRIGKSAGLVVRLAHRAFTFTKSDGNPNYNIVIFTPNQSQITVIFKMLELFIDGNPRLMSMVGVEKGSKGKIPTRKNPVTSLELTNGCTITGFVSGSTAIRGSAANLLVLDEGSFLTTEDTDSVVALLNEDENVEFWVSSTPKGLKDYFYERVNDKDTVDFYFPTDKFHPGWSMQMENLFKSQLTTSGYQHEVLANFSADGEGVFQYTFVEDAKSDFEYETQTYNPNWIYAIGVDWNDTANGSQIVVVGYNPKHEEEGVKAYRIVDKASVSIEGWTQTVAVKTVRTLNRKWRASTVYTDYGFGATQAEMLHDIGRKSPRGSIDYRLTAVKSINFSKVFVIRDPWLNKKIKKPAKPYMINNAVRIFEEESIEFPKSDELLEKQLIGYTIDSVSPNGIPRYAKDPKVGDHQLDALVLALLSFNLELSSMGKPVINESIRVIDSTKSLIGDSGYTYNDIDRRLIEDKKREAEEYEESHLGTTAFGRSDTTFARRVKPTRSRMKTTRRRRMF